jgi:hypothetical protein
MGGMILISEKMITGSLLILSGVFFLPGGILFTGRAIWKWPAGKSASYLIWERSFVIASILVVVVGLDLLEGLIETAGDKILAPAGMLIFLIGAILAVFAEAYFLSKHEWLNAPIVFYVILGFLGQMGFGFALLQTGLLPAWIGWATVGWSLIWLVVLPVARPRDMYFPVLYYVSPLLIGIALLSSG